MKFSDLGLSDELSRAVADLGYTSPTPIQEKSIPIVLMGRDILGSAQTGTGKTASFTLPMIDILASGRAKARLPRSLILAPTRELAAQVADSFEKFSSYHKLSMALLIGGVSFTEQNAALSKGVDVLIATPGRLLDHFERGKVLLNDVKILVIDEADRMLDMGFIPDVERIASLLPRMRQTLFFSATLSDDIQKLGAKFVMNPKVIEVAAPAATADTVAQHLIWTDVKKKRQILRDIDSLENHTAFLFDKINFLMDATVGFISLNQSKIIKIFSVVSVALMPPTLLASIWGMNFEFMPEVKETWGYPAAIITMIISAMIPLGYFRHKGWLKSN